MFLQGMIFQLFSRVRWVWGKREPPCGPEIVRFCSWLLSLWGGPTITTDWSRSNPQCGPRVITTHYHLLQPLCEVYKRGINSLIHSESPRSNELNISKKYTLGLYRSDYTTPIVGKRTSLHIQTMITYFKSWQNSVLLSITCRILCACQLTN